MDEVKEKETEELEVVEADKIIEKKDAMENVKLKFVVFKKKFLKYAYIAGIVALCVLIFFAAKGIYDSDDEEFKIVETEETITGETIMSGLESIGVLETQKYYYTHVESFISTEKVFGIDVPLTEKSFIYSCDGYVSAGIDFSAIVVDKSGSKITVKLPKSKINDSVLDEKSIKMYDEENSIFNPIKVDDVTKSLVDIKKKEEKNAIAKGILKEADANAKVLVENFIRNSYDVKDCEIIFEEIK